MLVRLVLVVKRTVRTVFELGLEALARLGFLVLWLWYAAGVLGFLTQTELLVRLVVGTLVDLGLQGSLAPCLRCLVRAERLLLIRLALVVVQEGYLVRV